MNNTFEKDNSLSNPAILLPSQNSNGICYPNIIWVIIPADLIVYYLLQSDLIYKIYIQ